MNARRGLLSVWLLMALLAAHPVGASSFADDVAVSPEQPDIETPVSLLVTFVTSTTPPFLFAPTVVEIDGFSIDVELFIDSGVLQAIASRTEEVELGILPAGVFDFSVRLTPRSDPPRVLTGSFQVVPEPAPLALAVVALVVLAAGRRRRVG